jgi:uncharacterized protein (TIGR00251 family)
VAKAEVKPRDFIRSTKDGVHVQLRVSPGAKSTAIKGLYGECAIKLSVAAPPTEGRANAEAERYLARLLRISRSEVSVVKGASSRDKLVFIRGVEPDEIKTRLNILL